VVRYENGSTSNGPVIPRTLRINFFPPGFNVDREVAFDLRPGESFRVHGLWADFYSESKCASGPREGNSCTQDATCRPPGENVATCGIVPTTGLDVECGKAPHYAPRVFRSSCYNDFSYSYDYDDIAGSSESVIRVESDEHTTTRRNDGCDVDLQFEIRID
jgi:hypothetical protein